MSNDGSVWTDEVLAQVDTGAALTVLFPWDEGRAARWAQSEEHLLTLDSASGGQVQAFGNITHVRLFSGAEAIEVEAPVYFLLGCKLPLVGLELLSTYFDISATAGEGWDLRPRADRQGFVIPIRDDHGRR